MICLLYLYCPDCALELHSFDAPIIVDLRWKKWEPRLRQEPTRQKVKRRTRRYNRYCDNKDNNWCDNKDNNWCDNKHNNWCDNKDNNWCDNEDNNWCDNKDNNWCDNKDNNWCCAKILHCLRLHNVLLYNINSSVISSKMWWSYK